MKAVLSFSVPWVSLVDTKRSIMSVADEEHESDDYDDLHLREIKSFCQYQLVLL